MADRRAEMARELADIKALLVARIESLARQLAPEGNRSGHYWMARNPMRDDRTPGSFWINLGGKAPGTWKDAATGEKGDALALIMGVMRCDFPKALDWARAWLGLSNMQPEQIARARAANERAQADRETREAEILADNRRAAMAMWLKGSDKLAATPVETYLRTRGIELSALAAPPRALRFAARKHRESGRFLSAMLACMTGPDETLWAVHQTFLEPDGSGKADVVPARKIWPSFRGAAIRLAKGETKMRPAEAAKHGLLDTLCLCEGVEDGLSIALACPELRVWAAGSLGNLAHITLPECCADVIVAADNDWGKPQAQKQLDAAVAALMKQGRPVRIARSFVGKDANDALRA